MTNLPDTVSVGYTELSNGYGFRSVDKTTEWLLVTSDDFNDGVNAVSEQLTEILGGTWTVDDDSIAVENQTDATYPTSFTGIMSWRQKLDDDMKDVIDYKKIEKIRTYLKSLNVYEKIELANFYYSDDMEDSVYDLSEIFKYDQDPDEVYLSVELGDSVIIKPIMVEGEDGVHFWRGGAGEIGEHDPCYKNYEINP